MHGTERLEKWGEEPNTSRSQAPPAPLRPGTRITVYWTELRQWFNGTYTSSRIEPSDDGGEQRASRIVYDAVGPWRDCQVTELTYYHCLDDETWALEKDHMLDEPRAPEPMTPRRMQRNRP